LSLTNRPNKLEGLSLETLSSQVLEFLGQGQSQHNLSAFQGLPSWVSSCCYQQMLGLTGKWLTGTNTLAYLASASATKEKSFITLTPECSECLFHQQRRSRWTRYRFKFFLSRTLNKLECYQLHSGKVEPCSFMICFCVELWKQVWICWLIYMLSAVSASYRNRQALNNS